MRIEIEFVRMDQMRYESLGDYWYDQLGTLQVRVVDTGIEFYNKSILVHELIEEALTKQKGTTEEQITDYDLAFEAARKIGLRTETEEPGFGENCCYLAEHSFATATEMAMMGMVGIRWPDYERHLNEL